MLSSTACRKYGDMLPESGGQDSSMVSTAEIAEIAEGSWVFNYLMLVSVFSAISAVNTSPQFRPGVLGGHGKAGCPFR